MTHYEALKALIEGKTLFPLDTPYEKRQYLTLIDGRLRINFMSDNDKNCTQTTGWEYFENNEWAEEPPKKSLIDQVKDNANIIVNLKVHPRFSGKTVSLKLQIKEHLEDRGENDIIVALAGFRGLIDNNLQYYFRNDDVIGSLKLRGYCNKDIYIYIDEPFIFKKHEVESVLSTCLMLADRNTITIIGKGTLEEHNELVKFI
jgi:hypothetical protein